MKMQSLNNLIPDKNGFFGTFGGQDIPEKLKNEFQKIEKTFKEKLLKHIIEHEKFLV